MAIFRRLSSSFKKKPDRNSVNGSSLPKVEESDSAKNETTKNGTTSNGSSTTPGDSIGKSLQKTKDVKTNGSYTPLSNHDVAEASNANDAPPATRKDIEDAFAQFAQLIHASRRPLPTQTGDGSYLVKDEPSGWLADIRSMGLKDVKTIKHIMEDKASGLPQDDRKMHMEEVMQVSIF